MFMSVKFKEQFKNKDNIEITRKGVAEKVIVPEDIKQRFTFDANVEGNNIVFSEGESVYILADEFGFLADVDGVETNIFFVDGGLVIEIVEGTILLKGENDQIFSVDEDGDIDYPNVTKKVNFITHDYVYEMALRVVGHKYSTPEELTPSYVDNLVLNTFFHYQETNVEPMFTVRFLAQYEDLGLEAFQFINYAEEDPFEAKEEWVDPSEIEDEEEDKEDEDNFDYEANEEDVEEDEADDEDEYEDSF